MKIFKIQKYNSINLTLRFYYFSYFLSTFLYYQLAPGVQSDDCIGRRLDDLDQIVPVFIMLLAMPISGSIGHGIGLAMISYTVIKVFSGKPKEVSVLTYIISVLFLIKFFLIV